MRGTAGKGKPSELGNLRKQSLAGIFLAATLHPTQPLGIIEKMFLSQVQAQDSGMATRAPRNGDSKGYRRLARWHVGPAV
jgi:hypothetical protein